MEIQQLSISNLKDLTELVLELWVDCSFEEEYENFKTILSSENEICYLVKEQGIYIAFTHFTIRSDYVEGATGFPVAYMEALYVKSKYQKLGIGKKLVNAGENWSKEKVASNLLLIQSSVIPLVLTFINTSDSVKQIVSFAL